MAPAVALNLWLLVGWMFLRARAAAVDASGRPSRLIRHEQLRLEALHDGERQAAQLGPHGELIDVGAHVEHSEKLHESDYCDEDYILGTRGTDDCPQSRPVERETMCVDAAIRMGVSRGNEPRYPFEVGRPYFEVYPRGCFKKNGDTPLWYNPFGALSNNTLEGTPVCHRPKYKLGSNDTNDGGCTGNYTKVLNETACRTFAECKGHCSPYEFRVGIAATVPGTDERPADSGAEFYDKRPKGCFRHHGDGCIYFNVPRDAEPAGTIQGAPVCMIKR